MSGRVVLGLVFPQRGRAACVSRASAQGIEIALALGSEDGVPWATRVELASSDASTPDAARREARRLVLDEGARVLVGSALSAVCLTASEVAEELGVLYWEVAAVADEVTTRGLRTVFRLNANAQAFAAEGIRALQTHLHPALGRARSVAVAHESSPFGESVGQAVAAAARLAGIAVTRMERFDGGEPRDRLAARLERLGESGADVLFATAGAREAAAIVRGRAAALRNVRAIIGVGGGWGSPELAADVGSELDGVFSVNNARALTLRTESLTAEAREMWRRYRDASAARAIPDPQADRDLSFIGTDLLVRHVLPTACDLSAEALRAAALGIDLPPGATITGMGVRFDEQGHNTRGIVVTMQWQRGVLRTVAPPALATHAIMLPATAG